MKDAYQSENRKFLYGILLAWLLLTGVTCFFFVNISKKTEENVQNCYVELRTLENAVNSRHDEELSERLQEILDTLLTEKDLIVRFGENWVCILYILVSVALWAGYIYLYRTVFRPFQKLERFAGRVARGEFDLPLDYERRNYFGAFTWAFDNMRIEIKRARSAELAAIENNKTVIATISHDIRTPIASMRAYCEALLAGIAETKEEKEEYLGVIMQKCDEVSTLTNDLLLHSLSDLKKLQMNFEVCDSEQLLRQIRRSVSFEREEIVWEEPIPNVKLNVDVKRLEQVYENLMGNAKKYAEGERVCVSQKLEDAYFVITLKDAGNGVPEEEIPFLFERFYRGTNTKDKEGAGLGLYITKYIVEQMGGTIMAKNEPDGFLVRVKLPVVKENK